MSVTTETANEAFAKAVEWQVVEKFKDISIRDDVESYTMDQFAAMLASL